MWQWGEGSMLGGRALLWGALVLARGMCIVDSCVCAQRCRLACGGVPRIGPHAYDPTCLSWPPHHPCCYNTSFVIY